MRGRGGPPPRGLHQSAAPPQTRPQSGTRRRDQGRLLARPPAAPAWVRRGDRHTGLEIGGCCGRAAGAPSSGNGGLPSPQHPASLDVRAHPTQRHSLSLSLSSPLSLSLSLSTPAPLGLCLLLPPCPPRPAASQGGSPSFTTPREPLRGIPDLGVLGDSLQQTLGAPGSPRPPACQAKCQEVAWSREQTETLGFWAGTWGRVQGWEAASWGHQGEASGRKGWGWESRPAGKAAGGCVAPRTGPGGRVGGSRPQRLPQAARWEPPRWVWPVQGHLGGPCLSPARTMHSGERDRCPPASVPSHRVLGHPIGALGERGRHRRPSPGSTAPGTHLPSGDPGPGPTVLCAEHPGTQGTPTLTPAGDRASPSPPAPFSRAQVPASGCVQILPPGCSLMSSRWRKVSFGLCCRRELTRKSLRSQRDPLFKAPAP